MTKTRLAVTTVLVMENVQCTKKRIPSERFASVVYKRKATQLSEMSYFQCVCVCVFLGQSVTTQLNAVAMSLVVL